jgi:hypothetical protein
VGCEGNAGRSVWLRGTDPDGQSLHSPVGDRAVIGQAELVRLTVEVVVSVVVCVGFWVVIGVFLQPTVRRIYRTWKSRR